MKIIELLENDTNKPKVIFHVTRSSNRSSIKSQGLIPQNKEFPNIPREPGIYGMETLEQAKDWAFWSMFDEHKPMDIWRIVVPENAILLPDLHPEIQEVYDPWIIKTAIPPSNIFLVATQSVKKHTKFAPPSAKKIRDIINEVAPREIPTKVRKWLTGRCYDFALALSERFPNSTFVAWGGIGHPEHVGIVTPDGFYYDARGKMTISEFCNRYRENNPLNPEKDIHPIDRKAVELHAGVAGIAPPYRGNPDIAEARRAVNSIFGPKIKN
jgi:hypothetical protein